MRLSVSEESASDLDAFSGGRKQKRPDGDRSFQHFVCWPCPFVSWKDFILKDGDFHMLNQRFLFILFFQPQLFKNVKISMGKVPSDRFELKIKLNNAALVHKLISVRQTFTAFTSMLMFKSFACLCPNKPSVLAVETERGHAGQEAAPC